VGKGREATTTTGSRFSQESGGRLSLPAIAAIAPVAAISTVAAAAPAAATAMSTTASAATAAETASTTTATALLLGTSFVDDEIASAKILAVHGIDRAIGFFVIGNFNESETTRLAGEPITNQIDCRGINTSLREKIMQRIFRCGKRKITNVELLHLRTPSARNLTAYRGARWKAVGILTGSPEKPKPPLIARRLARALNLGTESGAPAVRGIVQEIDKFCNEKLLRLGWQLVTSVGRIQYIGISDRMPPTYSSRREPMRGTMMDFPLTLPTLLERAGKLFPEVEILYRRPDRSVVRSNYRTFHKRARRLASSLSKLGLRPGDRVASMMWNHAGHLDAFFGVPCAGAILHTLNLRLHPHEIAAIVNHARDRFLIVDDVLLPIFEQFRAAVSFEKVIVAPYGCADEVPDGLLNLEKLLDEAGDDFVYPVLDENDGAAMCFTSGTTGCSKGVVYSHRALVLHAMAECMVDTFALNNQDTVLPVAPMFHANAWGVPHAGVMCGAKLMLSGPNVEPEGLLDWMVAERVTFASGVPTVWIGVLDSLQKDPGRWKFDWPVRIVCAGTAPPLELIRNLDRFGLRIFHLWGMTETTPLATAGRLKANMVDWPEEKKYEMRAKQGWPVPFLELRTMRPEGESPWDGETPGEIEVRGPWVAAEYFESPDQAHRWSADGWFKTGDVATIDGDGIVKIVDRAKDLVKSGGEWISSVDLENTLMGHPAVKEACVVGVPHPKWQERPLAAIVLKDGKAATADELRGFLAATFAKWQLPDAFVFLDAIPRTSVGKFKKIALREQFADWKWES
jgi:fatty-acyl-CoA synthase